MQENLDKNYGYIYILTNGSMPGLIKIGMTKVSSHQRADNLSKATGVPTPFVVAFEFFCPYFQCVEKEVHKHLAKYRINPEKEFFRCSMTLAQEVIKDCAPLVEECEDAKSYLRVEKCEEFKSYQDIPQIRSKGPMSEAHYDTGANLLKPQNLIDGVIPEGLWCLKGKGIKQGIIDFVKSVSIAQSRKVFHITRDSNYTYWRTTWQDLTEDMPTLTGLGMAPSLENGLENLWISVNSSGKWDYSQGKWSDEFAQNGLGLSLLQEEIERHGPGLVVIDPWSLLRPKYIKKRVSTTRQAKYEAEKEAIAPSGKRSYSSYMLFH